MDRNMIREKGNKEKIRKIKRKVYISMEGKALIGKR